MSLADEISKLSSVMKSIKNDPRLQNESGSGNGSELKEISIEELWNCIEKTCTTLVSSGGVSRIPEGVNVLDGSEIDCGASFNPERMINFLQRILISKPSPFSLRCGDRV